MWFREQCGGHYVTTCSERGCRAYLVYVALEAQAEEPSEETLRGAWTALVNAGWSLERDHGVAEHWGFPPVWYCPAHATLQEGGASSRSPEASADSMEKPRTNGSEGESG